jgi:prepilin-type N-terminal cleavage/methylation domain-containing protein
VTTTTRRRPAGFTLLELLVVIALLAVVAAIGVGTYFRVRASAQIDADEKTIAKLSTAFTQQWTAEVESAKDAFKGKANFGQYANEVAKVKAIAAQDEDRGLALWTYLWTKNAFPQTFAEATTPTTMAVTLPGPTALTVSLPARFSGLTGVTDNREQAAVLLHRILTQKGARGQTFDETAVGALSAVLQTTPPSNHRVFTDTHGNPLTFVRMCSGTVNADVNGGEYVTPGRASNDPFDPTNRLRTYTGNYTATVETQAAQSIFGPTVTQFPRQNWLPTIVGRGAESAWDPTFLTTTTGLITIPDGYLAGYKLRRQGTRGDR